MISSKRGSILLRIRKVSLCLFCFFSYIFPRLHVCDCWLTESSSIDPDDMYDMPKFS